MTRFDDSARDAVSWERRARPEVSVATFHDLLVQRYAHKLDVPSLATVRAILEERGWVAPPRLAEGRELDPPIPGTFAPNDVWCVELAGGAVAVVDSYTRYLVRLDPVAPRDPAGDVERTLRSAFREHGVPEILRARPAPPFLVDGPQGLSQLDLWIVRCGMVLDRRADAPFVSVGYPGARPGASFGEQLRAADLFRKRHNEAEVVGYRASSRPLGQAIDLREPFLAESVESDARGNVRWWRHRLALGPELARTTISFWGSEWMRFAEVRIKEIPLGLVDHLRPKRGLIPAPVLPRLSMTSPILEIDWEPILVEELRDEITAASRGGRRAPKRGASSEKTR